VSPDRSFRALLATRSVHKLAEIGRMIGAEGAAPVPGLEIVGLDEAGIDESPDEDGIESFDTFAENALAKASHFFILSGLPTLADDSGLVVDALGGMPGVRSKRFAPVGSRPQDEANNRHLLRSLEGVPPAERSARYVCVLALVGAGPEPLLARGAAEGRILETPRGRGGFGYDPLFVELETGMGFAEIAPVEKDRLSHRGRAIRKLGRELEERLPLLNGFWPPRSPSKTGNPLA